MQRTVVFAQAGSVRVVDATYLGLVFKTVEIGLSPWPEPQVPVPQDQANISYVRRPNKNASARS
jgi:hypothetical protein